MILHILNFIKNKKIHTKNIILPYAPIQNIYTTYYSNDNQLFQLDKILNHLRNFRKIVPGISALI